MITLLLYWISCKYKRDADFLYFLTLCLDIRLLGIFKEIINKL